MTFAPRRNRLTTRFSERILVIKRRIFYMKGALNTEVARVVVISRPKYFFVTSAKDMED